MELWDAVNGTVTQRKSFTADDGRLAIDLPEVKHDVAVKIK